MNGANFMGRGISVPEVDLKASPQPATQCSLSVSLTARGILAAVSRNPGVRLWHLQSGERRKLIQITRTGDSHVHVAMSRIGHPFLGSPLGIDRPSKGTDEQTCLIVSLLNKVGSGQVIIERFGLRLGSTWRLRRPWIDSFILHLGEQIIDGLSAEQQIKISGFL